MMELSEKIGCRLGPSRYSTRSGLSQASSRAPHVPVDLLLATHETIHIPPFDRRSIPPHPPSTFHLVSLLAPLGSVRGDDASSEEGQEGPVCEIDVLVVLGNLIPAGGVGGSGRAEAYAWADQGNAIPGVRYRATT